MEDYNYIASDLSSSEEAYYSDQIDSDIEAELYGLIHHDAQDNSISLQDKSDSVENESVSLHDKSGSTEINSVVQQSNLGSKVDNFASPVTNSVRSKDILNSNKKLKKSVKKSKQNSSSPVQNRHTNSFSSDTISNNALYTSFESPVQKQKIQEKKVQSENFKRNTVDKPVKRKSNLVSEILENIQSKRNMKSTEPENKVIKQEKTQKHDHIIDEELTFVEVIDDSSDSDTDSSIIFLEPDKSNIETNILKETVVLSSDAEDSDSSMEKSFSKACQRKQTAIAQVNFIPNGKDPWHINSEDKYRTKRPSSRYHEKAVLTCSRCQLKGHNAKFCSVPKAMKCFYCGSLHSGMNCRNKVCPKCLRQGHDYRHCYMRHFDTCEICRMRGHSKKNCPDIWRRYHLTTSKGAIVKGNPNSHTSLYCYNCGTRGHYGAECMENRTDKWSFPTWTSIVSYKNPSSIFPRKPENNYQENRNFDTTPSRKKKGNKIPPFNTPTNLQNKKRKRRKKCKTSPNTNHQSQTVQPNHMVQNEVYFPRTPKVTPTTSMVNSSQKKFRNLQNNEQRALKQRLLHRIQLQQRLGLSFPSSV